MFNFKNKRYINISYNSAQFSDKQYKHGSFNEKDFINHTEYLIDNCYTAIDNKVVQQVKGIRMGTNCASRVANIFIHVYEKSFISKLIEEDDNEYLDILGTVFRNQDDLDDIWKTYG